MSPLLSDVHNGRGRVTKEFGRGNESQAVTTELLEETWRETDEECVTFNGSGGYAGSLEYLRQEAWAHPKQSRKGRRPNHMGLKRQLFGRKAEDELDGVISVVGSI
jgi:hypothetical protein